MKISSGYLRKNFTAKHNTSSWCILLYFSSTIFLALTETTGWHWDLNSDSAVSAVLVADAAILQQLSAIQMEVCVIFLLKKIH